MASCHGKKPLYEVIGKSKLKADNSKTSEKPSPAQPEATDQESSALSQSVNNIWLKKPKIMQVNAGRVEFSLPYPLVIAMLMVVILLGLVVFRAGQTVTIKQSQPSIAEPIKPRVSNAEKIAKKPTTRPAQPIPAKKVVPAKPKVSTGNNHIVIIQHSSSRDLGPVQKYFAKAGIETEIVKIGSSYFLRTKNKYQNPSKSGTDGYKAKAQIMKWGANYKTPEGYANFGKKPFQGVYGKVFK